MLLPPQFSGCVEDSFVSSFVLNEQQSDRKISVSSSTTLANVGTLVDEGIQMILGSQIKAGHRKLKEALIRLENQQNTRAVADFYTHISCLYYLSYSLNYLDNYEDLVVNNWKFISLLQKNINVPHSLHKQNSVKLKVLYSNFLLFSSQILSAKNKNREAYSQAKKAHTMVLELFDQAIQSTNIYNFQCVSNQKIQFGKLISQKIVPKIIHLVQEDRVNNISQSQILKQIKKSMAAWKTNIAKNLQQLKAETNKFQNSSPEKRNILGVKPMQSHKKQKNKPNQYSKIKDLVVLQIFNFQELQSSQNVLLELSGHNFDHKVKTLLSAYFFMSISLYQLQIQERSQKYPEFASSLSKRSEYIQLKKDHQSELLMLKSIAIAINYLKQEQKIIGQLISQYQLKYQGDIMNQIKEEDSKLQLSSSGKQFLLKRSQDQKQEEQMPKNIYYKMNKPEKSIFSIKGKNKYTKSNDCSQKTLKKQKSQSVNFLKSHKRHGKAGNNDNSVAKYCKSERHSSSLIRPFRHKNKMNKYKKIQTKMMDDELEDRSRNGNKSATGLQRVGRNRLRLG